MPDVQQSGKRQRRAPIDISEDAECSDSRKERTKTSSEQIFQWKGKQVGDAEPDVVDGHGDAVELLREDQQVDRARSFWRWTQESEDETFQKKS